MPDFEDRERLADAIGRDTLEAWQNRGARCLEELSEDDPVEFLRFCLSVLPSTVALDLEGGGIGVNG